MSPETCQSSFLSCICQNELHYSWHNVCQAHVSLYCRRQLLHFVLCYSATLCNGQWTTACTSFISHDAADQGEKGNDSHTVWQATLQQTRTLGHACETALQTA